MIHATILWKTHERCRRLNAGQGGHADSKLRAVYHGGDDEAALAVRRHVMKQWKTRLEVVRWRVNGRAARGASTFGPRGIYDTNTEAVRVRWKPPLRTPTGSEGVSFGVNPAPRMDPLMPEPGIMRRADERDSARVIEAPRGGSNAAGLPSVRGRVPLAAVSALQSTQQE